MPLLDGAACIGGGGGGAAAAALGVLPACAVTKQSVSPNTFVMICHS